MKPLLSAWNRVTTDGEIAYKGRYSARMPGDDPAPAGARWIAASALLSRSVRRMDAPISAAAITGANGTGMAAVQDNRSGRPDPR